MSAFSPHGSVDSNAHRAELRAIGWKMIRRTHGSASAPNRCRVKSRTIFRPARLRSRAEYYGHLENNYIQYAAERGIPTMLALMWMIAWALRDFARALRRLPAGAEQRWVLHAAVARHDRRARRRFVLVESECQLRARDVSGRARHRLCRQPHSMMSPLRIPIVTASVRLVAWSLPMIDAT